MSKEDVQAQLRAAYAEGRLALRSGRAATLERQLSAIQAAAPGESTACACWELLSSIKRKYQPPSRPSRARCRALRTSGPHTPILPVLTAERVGWRRRARNCGGWSPPSRRSIRRGRAYGDLLVDLEKYPDARVAYDRARLADPHRTRIEQATAAILAENRTSAEVIFRDILKMDPSHVGALCGLAAISLTVSRGRDAASAVAACSQAVRASAPGLARPVPDIRRSRTPAGSRSRSETAAQN